MLVVIVLGFVASARAGDPNEAIGFTTNHLMADGGFGENIDLLTGTVNMSFPIGPSYQVGPSLSYQFVLHYTTSSWSYDAEEDSTMKPLPGRINVTGCFGAGIRGHLGRVYRDYHDSDGTGTSERVWRLETPDGSQHYFGTESSFLQNGSSPYLTVDRTYFRMTPLHDDADGTADGWVAELPDGTRWILDHEVGNPENPRDPRPDKGWYVTRIEGAERHDCPVGEPNPPAHCLCEGQQQPHYDCARPHFVKVSYAAEGNAPTAACPSMIEDSVGRELGFQMETGHSVVSGITLPAGTFNFEYSHNQLLKDPRCYLYYIDGCDGNALYRSNQSILKRILYPASPSRFNVYLEWAGENQDYNLDGTIDGADASGTLAQWNFGQIVGRTIPNLAGSTNPASVRYTYKYITFAKDRSTRAEASQKVVRTGLGEEYRWRYQRPDDDQDQGQVGAGQQSVFQAIEATNPSLVRVWDPFNNVTEYSFMTQWLQLGEGNYEAADCWPYTDTSEPVWKQTDECPSYWDSGLLTHTRVYRGCTASIANLVRETVTEHDVDRDQDGTPLLFRYRPAHFSWPGWSAYTVGRNVREKKQTTTYHDGALQSGGPPSVSVEYQDWDGYGHYERTVEKNENNEIHRMRFMDYQAPAGQWFLGRYSKVVLEDATGTPIERTDYCWGETEANATKPTDIVRRKVPTSNDVTCTAAAGDVFEALEYVVELENPEQPLGVLKLRDISGGDLDSSFKTKYTYAPGSYLKTRGPDGQSWLSLDRDWDSERGLVEASRDSAGVRTDYDYDALGRLTRIQPPQTAPDGEVAEAPTDITYAADGRSVTVTQDAGLIGTVQGEYFYDPLYRLERTKRLNADWTSSEQESSYDALNRLISQTVWTIEGQEPEATSILEYGAFSSPSCLDINGDGVFEPGAFGPPNTYPDPLGRITRTVKGGVETTTAYDGLKSTVTSSGIAAPSGVNTVSKTLFVNDAFGRLVEVHPLCATSQWNCDASQPLPAAAQALYSYDVQDRLIDVMLTDSIGLETQPRHFGYDTLGRLRSATNPENGTQLFSKYDALGNLREKVDSQSRTITYEYDAAGRLTKTEGSGTPHTRETRSYDPTNGRLQETITYEVNGSSQSMNADRTLVYGGHNKRLSEIHVRLGGWSENPPLLKTLYKYNSLGQVSYVYYPRQDGDTRTRSVPYYVSSNGYVTQVGDLYRTSGFDGYLSSIGYSPSGAVASIYGPLLQHLEVQPDSWNRPKRYTLGRERPCQAQPTQTTGVRSGEFLWPFPQPGQTCSGGVTTDVWWDSGDYEYDGVGNIASIGTNSYLYDPLGRLVQATTDAGQSDIATQMWTYDSFGNMTEERRLTNGIDVWTKGFLVSPQTNRLQSVTKTYVVLNEEITSDHTYDQSGNMTGDGKLTFSWDDFGRMSSVESVEQVSGVNQVQTVARYIYDGTGHRVRKIEEGVETFYIRDEAGQVLSEFRRPSGPSAPPGWDKDYVYALGRAVAMVKNKLPAAPKNLRVTSIGTGGTSLTLQWDAPSEPDLASSPYKVTRCMPDPFCEECGETCVPFGWQPDTQKTDSFGTVDSGTVLHYFVKVKDSASNISETEAALAVRPVAPNPSQPSGAPQATAGDRKVRLRWALGSEEDLAGYRVLRSTAQQAAQSVSGSDPVRTECSPGAVPAEICFTDLGLTNGTAYTYRIKAVDTAHRESTESPAVDATPIDNEPPTPPSSLRTVSGPGPGQATVSWSAGFEDDIHEYRIFRTLTNQAPDAQAQATATVAAGMAGSTMMWNDSGMPAGQDVFYFIRVTDHTGNVSPPMGAGPIRARISGFVPQGVSGTFLRDDRETGPQYPDPPGPPPPPCDPAGAGDDRAIVELTYTGDGSAVRYKVYRRQSSLEPWQFIGDTLDLTFKDANVGRPHYEYAVSSLFAGNGEGPNSATAIVDDTFGTPAYGADFQGVDFIVGHASGYAEMYGPDRTFVVLSWSPSVEQRLVGYNVYRLCQPDVFLAIDQNCPGGWERISDLQPITDNYYLDLDVNPSVRSGRSFINAEASPPWEAKAYPWIYAVTAVLEDPSGNRFETKEIGSEVFQLETCIPEGEGDGTSILTCGGNCTAAPVNLLLHGHTHESALPSNGPPAAPMGLVAAALPEPDSEVIEVKWDPPSSYSSIAGYHLYYSPNGADDWKPVDTYAEDLDEDGTLELGSRPVLTVRFPESVDTKVRWRQHGRFERTQYKVRAVDQLGRESADSSIVLASIPAPPPPGSLTVRHKTQTQHRLRWVDNDSDPRSGDFRVERRVEGEAQWETVDLFGRLPCYQIGNEIEYYDPPLDLDGTLGPDGNEPAFPTPFNGQAVYEYRARAVYGSGAAEYTSVWSDIKTRNGNYSGPSERHCIGGTSLTGHEECQAQLSSPARSKLEVRMLACLELKDDPGSGTGLRGLPSEGRLFDAEIMTSFRPDLAHVLPADSVSPVPGLSGVARIGVVNPPWEVSLLWADHLGSTRVVSSISGDRITRHAYYPFGESVLPFGEAVPSGPDFASKEFTGHERDRETALDYMYARYYSASTGRFLTVDPASDITLMIPGSWNKFAYVLDNPLVHSDPTGKHIYYMPGADPAVQVSVTFFKLSPTVAKLFNGPDRDLYIRSTTGSVKVDGKEKHGSAAWKGKRDANGKLHVHRVDVTVKTTEIANPEKDRDSNAIYETTKHELGHAVDLAQGRILEGDEAEDSANRQGAKIEAEAAAGNQTSVRPMTPSFGAAVDGLMGSGITVSVDGVVRENFANMSRAAGPKR